MYTTKKIEAPFINFNFQPLNNLLKLNFSYLFDVTFSFSFSAVYVVVASLDFKIQCSFSYLSNLLIDL